MNCGACVISWTMPVQPWLVFSPPRYGLLPSMLNEAPAGAFFIGEGRVHVPPIARNKVMAVTGECRRSIN